MSRIIPDLVIGSDKLPSHADVVIIGGGIVGVCSAYYLSRRGIKVVVCEKGLIGAEQSSRNWGWVRQMGRDPAEIPISMRSLELWRGIEKELGENVGFRQTGIAYVCRSENELETYRRMARSAQDYHLETEILDSAGLSRLLPGITENFVGGMYTASDGKAEPTLATSAIARGAERAGATIMTRCAVRGLETEAGAVSAVVTEIGVIKTRQVILAGGAWSRVFCTSVGIDLPILKVVGSVARIASVDGLPEMPLATSNFAFRRRLDGGYTISMRNANLVPIVPDSFRLFSDFSPKLLTSWRELKLRFGRSFFQEAAMPRSWPLDQETVFERVRVLDPEPANSWLKRGIELAGKAFPALRGAKITKSWAGVIDTTPDVVPIIGPAPTLPGLFLATGFSGHGFGIGPGAGLLAAEMICGEQTIVDPAPFRMERFQRKRLQRHAPTAQQTLSEDKR